MTTAPNTLRRLGLMTALLVVVLSVMPLSRPATATTTYNACDLDTKYWCYAETFNTYSGGDTIVTRYVWGGLGNGGALNWRRRVLQDWQYTGSWTFLGSWAATSWRNTNGTESITFSRDINDEAVIRSQNEFQPTGGGANYCDQYIDWHIDLGSYFYMEGPLNTCV